MDETEIYRLWAGEPAPGIMDNCAHMDARNGDGPHCCTCGASAHDCILRMGGEYGGAGARTGGVCESGKTGGSRSVQGQIERGDRDYERTAAVASARRAGDESCAGSLRRFVLVDAAVASGGKAARVRSGVSQIYYGAK